MPWILSFGGRVPANISQWNKIVGGDAAEIGSGPGSYDIRKIVWHVNVSGLAKQCVVAPDTRQIAYQPQCCSPEIGGGGGWGIFNSLLGTLPSAALLYHVEST